MGQFQGQKSGADLQQSGFHPDHKKNDPKKKHRPENPGFTDRELSFDITKFKASASINAKKSYFSLQKLKNLGSTVRAHQC